MKKQITNFRILASEYGQFNTIKKWSALDKNNNEIPWYTYPALEYIKNIDFHNKTVFEYGSGNSSTYWARVCKNIISIEDNEEWYKKISSSILENQKIVLEKEKDNYVKSISRNSIGKFDIVIIDGNYRDECAKQAIINIKSDGMIILDNSEREAERQVSKYIRENFDCIQVDFHGFGPINSYTWTTSIFFSRTWSFSPINNTQPVPPMGSISAT